jgi:replicative DNA helicase
MDVQIRAENVILHEVLANPGDIHQLMDKVEETMFVDPTNKLVFNAVHKLYINQDPINTTSLIVEINKSKSIFSKEAVIQLSKIISRQTPAVIVKKTAGDFQIISQYDLIQSL